MVLALFGSCFKSINPAEDRLYFDLAGTADVNKRENLKNKAARLQKGGCLQHLNARNNYLQQAVAYMLKLPIGYGHQNAKTGQRNFILLLCECLFVLVCVKWSCFV